MVTKCLVVNRWCCANLRPVFMLSSALLMSLVLSFVLCLGSTFSVLRLCGQKQQSAKQPTNHNTTVQTALQNKIFFILMSTSNEGTVISHSPTASPAVPACVPSQLVSGRWYLGALRRKRPLLCWRRFHLRSVDSAASGFPPVSSAPGVMRQTASQLRIFCMDFICPNEHTHTHAHTPLHGTSSPPLPPPSVLFPTPPSAFPAPVGTSPVTMATHTGNTAESPS